MKNKKALLLPGIILFFLSAGFSVAQSSGVNPFYRPENIKKFAEYLFKQKDYLRSFYEYSRYLRTQNNDTVRFKIALGFQRMHRYAEALTHFEGLFFNSSFTNQSRNEFFKTLFLSDSLKYLTKIADKKFYRTCDSLRIPVKLAFAAKLFLKSPLPDSVAFSRAFDGNEKPAMNKFYSERKSLPYKEPLTAALLSTAVPGLGKIYTGNYGDGITAFIFTTALGYIAYDNFGAGHNFRAWLFSGLTALFYGGNIYGSYAAAQIFNAKVNFNFIEKVGKYLESKNFFIPEYKF